MSAPVALFVYNRADNTRKTLRALMANTLAPQTDLYVFSDGGRDEASWVAVKEVRAVLHETAEEVARARTLNSMTIVERPTNYYLERNVIKGINEVFQHHDTIIVLEDDIVTAPHFLEFMNTAFDMYRDDSRVMHVSGFTRIEETQLSARACSLDPSRTFNFPLGPTGRLTLQELSTFNFQFSTYFSPFMAGWGWGTWRDRWQQHFCHYQSCTEALNGLDPAILEAIEYGGVFPCLKHLDRHPIPWDLCWSLAIRRAGGLCLYPSRPLVRNIGLDSGTHYGFLPKWLVPLLQRYEYDREPYTGPITLTRQEPAVNPAIEAAMKEALTDWGIRYTWLGRLVRKIYHRFA